MGTTFEFDTTPKSLDDMVLYHDLREHLEYYLSTGDFDCLIFHGDTGTGKTTAAQLISVVITPFCI